jgi:hypothetical protein
MARFTPLARRSRTKYPPQHSRAADAAGLFGESGPDATAGGGGGAGGGATAAVALRQWWQGPPLREIRGVIVAGRVSPRLCAIV